MVSCIYACELFA